MKDEIKKEINESPTICIFNNLVIYFGIEIEKIKSIINFI